jgi:putative SOS response-associated peptidase YedK
MPGRLFLTTPTQTVAETLGAPLPDRGDPPRENIAPGQEVLACLPGRALTWMRWGMIPVGRVNARGRPVMEVIVNARSESLFEKSAFDGVRPCVVPVNGWYEWTGPARRKTAWRIRHRRRELLYFAAIRDVWTAPNGAELLQLATVTCPPSADVAAIHDRMGVLLAPEALDDWMSGQRERMAPLMVPAPENSLLVEEAREVDWSGP